MINPTDMKMEPLDIKQELDPDSTTGNRPKKKPGRPKGSKGTKQTKITEHGVVVKKEKKKHDRFHGMPEEEVLARLLPDRLDQNLDIVIVGINPGLYAAYVGHHYAGPGNHFWKCMFLSGLIPEPMTALQDLELLKFGIGFTNIVARTSRGSADLTRKEIKEGAEILTEKLLKYKPKIAVFNGKGIYEVFVGHKNFYFGKQPDPLPGTNTAVYVMPSSSARCSQLPRAIDKVPFYNSLRKFRDHLIGKLPDLDDSEITFPDLELKTAKKEPKVEVKDEYPGENPEMSGEAGLQQMMGGAYQFTPHSQHQPTYQDFQGNSEFSSQGLPQIKQEPGTISMPPGHQPMVTVKQEPGLEPGSCPGQSNTSYQSQGYNNNNHQQQQAMSYPSSNGNMDSFLHGINGLVERFGAPGQYGVVQQSGQAGHRPVQFNDALCDILTEGSTFELVPQQVQQQSGYQQQPPQQEQGNKKAKKRKSTSSVETSSPPQPANGSPPMSQAADLSQPSSVPICQPLPVYGQPPFTQGYPMYPPSSMVGSPPFPYPNGPNGMPTTTQPGQDPNMAVSQPSSYAQMMNVSMAYPSVPVPFTTQGFMPPGPGMPMYAPHPGQYPGQYPGQSQGAFVDSQGQYPGPQAPQAVTVKQEKPDN